MRIGPSAIASFVVNGLFAQLAQILILRELLVVLDGDELALGVMLAAWLVWGWRRSRAGNVACALRQARAAVRYSIDVGCHVTTGGAGAHSPGSAIVRRTNWNTAATTRCNHPRVWQRGFAVPLPRDAVSADSA